MQKTRRQLAGQALLSMVDVKAPLVFPAKTRQPSRTSQELLDDDAQYVLRPWWGPDEPLPIVKGNGIMVQDADGREYLDFTAGYFVNQAGHCHPRIVNAAIEQLRRVSQVSGRHASEPSILLAKRLAAVAPGRLAKTLFTTGGCESFEFAIKMTRQASGKPGVLCLTNAFHGLSVTALAACSNEQYRATAAVPLDASFVRAPTPYCYRCSHESSCALQCVDELERLLDAHPEIGTLAAEAVQSVGGIIPPQEWWLRVDALRRERGILLMLDEIQTGLGRTGALFAGQHYQLEPDVMALAKGLSGGVGSLGAVMCTSEVAAGFQAGTSPTSGGNAVSCAAGLALLETVLDEELCENATAMGRYLGSAIAERALPWVGDIRFKGLLGGVELVKSRAAKVPIEKETMNRIKSTLLELGVIASTSGPLGNVVRIQPPLSVEREQIDVFVDRFAQAVTRVCSSALAE
ncbi:MAG: aspartate aminotransferase family protein [Pseudomonadota bacterium]